MEVVGHELAAVVVAQLEATCAVLGEGAEARPDPLPDRLEGLEAGSLAHCGARRHAALILESGEPRRGGLCEIACRPPVDTYNPVFWSARRAQLLFSRSSTVNGRNRAVLRANPAMLTVPPEDGDPLGTPFEREQSILAETLLDLQVRPARPGMLSRARAGRR